MYIGTGFANFAHPITTHGHILLFLNDFTESCEGSVGCITIRQWPQSFHERLHNLRHLAKPG